MSVLVQVACGAVAVASAFAASCADYYDKAPVLPPPSSPAGSAHEPPKRPAFVLGKGVPQEVEDSAWALTLHCDAGEGHACTELGKLHASSEWGARDLAAAARMHQKGCAFGDAQACENLADAYTRGVGVAVDRARGRELYEKACQAHRGFACGTLGSFYAVGYGVAKDPSRARGLLARACDDGDSDACHLVGAMSGCDAHEKEACAELAGLKSRFDAQDLPGPPASPAASPAPSPPKEE